MPRDASSRSTGALTPSARKDWDICCSTPLLGLETRLETHEGGTRSLSHGTTLLPSVQITVAVRTDGRSAPRASEPVWALRAGAGQTAERPYGSSCHVHRASRSQRIPPACLRPRGGSPDRFHLRVRRPELPPRGHIDECR